MGRKADVFWPAVKVSPNYQEPRLRLRRPCAALTGPAQSAGSAVSVTSKVLLQNGDGDAAVFRGQRIGV